MFKYAYIFHAVWCSTNCLGFFLAFYFLKFKFKALKTIQDQKEQKSTKGNFIKKVKKTTWLLCHYTCENILWLTNDMHANNSNMKPHLVLSEGKQRWETLATYRTHVVFGGAAMRLSVFTKAVLREECSGAHVTLVVSFNEVCLLLSRSWCKN